MAKRISYKANNGDTLEGEIALPPGSGKAPAVVVVQEWWGVNDHIRSLVDRFAAAGFVAFAPDLYHGTVVKAGDADTAMKQVMALDKAKAVGEIGDAVALLAAHERSTGKVGVTGFCVGGALTFAAAAKVPGIAAVVPFYGVPPIPFESFASVKVPILAHFAKHDDHAKPSSAEEIKQIVTKGGGSMELHVYDAQHAFANDTRPEVYDENSAKLAWDRTIAFFEKHLA